MKNKIKKIILFISLVLIGTGFGIFLIGYENDDGLALAIGVAFAIISFYLWPKFARKFNL